MKRLSNQQHVNQPRNDQPIVKRPNAKWQNVNRRQALACGAAIALTATSQRDARATEGISVEEISQDKGHQICVFTKPFNSLSFDELADRIAELGFNGIEAPIRPKGHIEPADVEEELPKLVEALKKRGLEITVLTSNIASAEDPLDRSVLAIAASLGIKRYRMQYLKYDLSRPVVDQIKEWKPQLRELAELNKELGIKAIYQNHASNKNLGATIWDLREVLEGISPEHIAVAYDIRHAIVEGGMSWPISFNMIRPHIDTVYVKDFIWKGPKVVNVPLGEGLVSQRFFKLLKASKFAGPISLHEEYLDHKRAELVPDHLVAMKKDLATLKNMISKS
ncbi:MAG: sugar phosphate isomerase/epimerase family protein [Mariniblastus sp.]